MNMANGAELAKNDALVSTGRVVGILMASVGAAAHSIRAHGTPAMNKNLDLIEIFAWSACAINLAINR